MCAMLHRYFYMYAQCYFTHYVRGSDGSETWRVWNSSNLKDITTHVNTRLSAKRERPRAAISSPRAWTEEFAREGCTQDCRPGLLSELSTVPSGLDMPQLLKNTLDVMLDR